MGFTLAITGRPNVGKSTFFNRLLEQRKAIVDDISGVTRDRQYGITDWNGKSFNVIDTGGFVPHSDDVFEREIRKQVTIAIEEANAIVFMTDAAIGITHLDDAMAGMLRKSSKPVFLVVNKVDNNERMLAASEFYSLGFDKIFFYFFGKRKWYGRVARCNYRIDPRRRCGGCSTFRIIAKVCNYWSTKCWKIIFIKFIDRAGAYDCERYCRHHKRYHSYAL